MQTSVSFGMFHPAGETLSTYESEFGHLLPMLSILSEAVFMCRTLEQAASVPVVYATAYYSLVVRGRLRPGESVLIHSGSGGVGQAAIAIALSMRCRVFTTVGK